MPTLEVSLTRNMVPPGGRADLSVNTKTKKEEIWLSSEAPKMASIKLSK